MPNAKSNRFKKLTSTNLPGCCGVQVLSGFNSTGGQVNRTLDEALQAGASTVTHGAGVATLDQKQYEKYGAQMQVLGWKLVGVANNPGEEVYDQKQRKYVRKPGNDIFIFVKIYNTASTAIGKRVNI